MAARPRQTPRAFALRASRRYLPTARVRSVTHPRVHRRRLAHRAHHSGASVAGSLRRALPRRHRCATTATSTAFSSPTRIPSPLPPVRDHSRLSNRNGRDDDASTPPLTWCSVGRVSMRRESRRKKSTRRCWAVELGGCLASADVHVYVSGEGGSW